MLLHFPKVFKMNITSQILNLVKKSKEFPVVVTNKDYNIIQESSNIVNTLESDGYRVEEFVDMKNQVYGFKVYESKN